MGTSSSMAMRKTEYPQMALRVCKHVTACRSEEAGTLAELALVQEAKEVC